MTTPYTRIGGEPTIAAIANCFYDLIEQDPAYADLRAIHAADLSAVRHGLARFLTGWAGGPRDWFERGQCIMTLHRAFPITPALADQWSAAMTRAIDAQPGLDPDLASALAKALDHMAHAMINLSLDQDAA
ncbi:globin [Sphingobium sp. LB126]|uniref:group II truncated hemoglobin n=1 Tax=Sphingobium sp. LB126 TaxID=1983755 RepID=UPI000C202BC1|nr:group II truncated hemoglobin [Sphingobium sp. LB126]PJG48722.1 globin [Sphingobium sp. LB126]